MKYLLSLLITLLSCTLSFGTTESDLLNQILNSQKKYYKERICKSKDSYDSASYNSILVVAKKNRALLLSKIKEIDTTFNITKLSKFYILEGWVGTHGYLLGEIWYDSTLYSYSWGLNNGIKVSKLKLSKGRPLIQDIEKWDSSIKSKSICCSDVTDGSFNICSKIVKGANNIWEIETIAFYDYR